MGSSAYDRVPSGKMKTFCRVSVMVWAAVSKVARETARLARSMKTVFESATETQ